MDEVVPQALYRKIVMLMMRSKRHLSQVVEQCGMTSAQGMLIILFEPGGGISMQRLSCLMGCDASNVTGLVERLDSQELIERTFDPQDRRVKLVGLNAKGVARRDALLRRLQAAEATDLQRLSPAEQTTLAQLIDKISGKV